MKHPQPDRSLMIHGLLDEALIIPDLRASDREGALREMIRLLCVRDRRYSGKELYEKLLQRERLGSTAVGDGYAIPHCKVKALDDPMVLLAVSRKGVAYDAIDEKPIHVFFLVVTSAENPSVNLRILAAVAHLIRRSRPLLKKMQKARSGGELIALVRDVEEKLG
ncbi:MAG: PTS sugar transporter subunit IIA [Candidatus Aminicenantes bacterium]|nr:PTS sugar transporter subunit IIA [Candidatus Aminicenantes bacterium]